MSVNNLKMTWIKPKHVAVIVVLKTRRLSLLITDKFNVSFFYDHVTVHRNKFLYNKTN